MEIVTIPTLLQLQHNLTMFNFSWVRHETGSANHHIETLNLGVGSFAMAEFYNTKLSGVTKHF